VLPATSATELIRAASLTSFPEVARSCGLQPEALLLEAGIDRRALQDPEMRISAPAFGRLLELAAQQAKVEAFGLHMGETRSIAILGFAHAIEQLAYEELRVGSLRVGSLRAASQVQSVDHARAGVCDHVFMAKNHDVTFHAFGRPGRTGMRT